MLNIIKYVAGITALILIQIYAYKRFMPDEGDVFVAVNLCLLFIVFLITRGEVDKTNREFRK